MEALRIAVAEAVTRALGGSLQPPDEDVPLPEALRAVGQLLGGDLYVVLDQAEEYFLYHGGEDGAGTFAVEFPAVVTRPDLRVNFLLAIREDALAKLDVFKGADPGRARQLPPARAPRPARRPCRDRGADGALQPAGRGGGAVSVEPALVDAVLEQVVAGKVDVGQAGRGAVAGGDGGGRIETPYLQLAGRGGGSLGRDRQPESARRRDARSR